MEDKKTNSLVQYDNGLTKQVEESTRCVIKKLCKLVNIESLNYKQIVNYLNDEESLITPGFLLKRQIQEVYLEIFKQAVEKLGLEEYANLTEEVNCLWTGDKNKEEKLVRELKKQLKSKIKNETGVEWDAFEDYILDKRFPRKREILLKLAIAFRMDEQTLIKFLLSCSEQELQVRNPIDYIYLYCSKTSENGFANWERVESLIKMYEDKEAMEKYLKSINFSTENVGNQATVGGTTLLRDGLSSLTEEYLPENVKNISDKDIIYFMWKNKIEFTNIEKTKKYGKESIKGSYGEGFSLGRKQKFLRILDILYYIYPEYITDSVEGSTRKVKKSNYSQIVQSMLVNQNWDSLEDANVLKDNDKPYIRYVHMTYKEFRKNVRKILNLNEGYEITKPVERKDILILSYMFIAGFSELSEIRKEEVREKVLELEKEEEIPELQKSVNFYYYINNVIDIIMEIEEDKPDNEEIVRNLEECINLILTIFEYNDIYLPFLLDRFVFVSVLISVLGSDKDHKGHEGILKLVEQLLDSED